MPYRFAKESQDYTDYASGRVFYGLPGHPAFPVRLVSEIFQRCLAIRKAWGVSAPCVLYDPCCGGAYHLSVLAYLFWQRINSIIGSDVDERALALAARFLGSVTDFPLLFQCGVADEFVPIADVRRSVEILKANYGQQRLVELVEYEGIGHQPVPEMFTKAAEWMTTYLLRPESVT
jgi:pimeloyl-ACP methyl ester carboxylesterase